MVLPELANFELLDTFGVEPEPMTTTDTKAHQRSSFFPEGANKPTDLLEETSQAIDRVSKEQPALNVLKSDRTSSSNVQVSFKTPRVIQLDSSEVTKSISPTREE